MLKQFCLENCPYTVIFFYITTKIYIYYPNTHTVLSFIFLGGYPLFLTRCHYLTDTYLKMLSLDCKEFCTPGSLFVTKGPVK